MVIALDDNAIPFHILREAIIDFSNSNVTGKGGFAVVYREGHIV